MGNDSFLIKAGKMVTVGDVGTLENAGMLVREGRITRIGEWDKLAQLSNHFNVIDYSDYVVVPGLIDCHTHLLEFAPTSVYPATEETYRLSVNSIILQALSSGITALGEQLCGHPDRNWDVDKYKELSKSFPLDICFSLSTISIGFEKLAHFSAMTKSEMITEKILKSEEMVQLLAQRSEYPGENLFINATPANFTPELVPRAGEVIYSLSELQALVHIFHQLGKRIGVHVGGVEAIKMALDAKVDILHHAHGISDGLIKQAVKQGTCIVATPLGGTHLTPNSPEEITALVDQGVTVAIATDAYLPAYPDVPWLSFAKEGLHGPETLMELAHPAMTLLREKGWEENQLLALITSNPAKILGKENQYGRLEEGLEANFIVSKGIPGLEVTAIEDIVTVYYRGRKVIDRLRS